MKPSFMNLSILLPFRVFAQENRVSRIVVETTGGSYGLLPRRLDCVAALTPGILTWENEGGEEFYVAVDSGLLAKTGPDVLISVRGALGGSDLEQLREAVQDQFSATDDLEQGVRSIMTKLETGFLRRFAEFRHE